MVIFWWEEVVEGDPAGRVYEGGDEVGYSKVKKALRG